MNVKILFIFLFLKTCETRILLNKDSAKRVGPPKLSYPQSFTLFRKLFNDQPVARFLMGSDTKPQNVNFNAIKKPQMRDLMLQIKEKDKEFYDQLKKMNLKQKKRYLRLHKRKLFSVGGGLLGLGLMASGPLVYRFFTQDSQIRKLTDNLIKTGTDLATSRLQRNQEFENLQTSLLLLESQVGKLNDNLNSQPLELQNAIDTKLTT